MIDKIQIYVRKCMEVFSQNVLSLTSNSKGNANKRGEMEVVSDM